MFGSKTCAFEKKITTSRMYFNSCVLVTLYGFDWKRGHINKSRNIPATLRNQSLANSTHGQYTYTWDFPGWIFQNYFSSLWLTLTPPAFTSSLLKWTELASGATTAFMEWRGRCFFKEIKIIDIKLNVETNIMTNVVCFFSQWRRLHPPRWARDRMIAT